MSIANVVVLSLAVGGAVGFLIYTYLMDGSEGTSDERMRQPCGFHVLPEGCEDCIAALKTKVEELRETAQVAHRAVESALSDEPSFSLLIAAESALRLVLGKAGKAGA